MRRILTVSLLWLFVVSTAHAQTGVSVLVNTVDAVPLEDGTGYSVTAFISAVDSTGAVITGLSASNFIVREDGRDITDFQVAQTTNAINLVLAIDTSESMTYGGRMDAAIKAGAAFLQSATPEDQVALMSFNATPTVEHTFTNNSSDVISVLNKLAPVQGGITCLWDAAYSAAELAAGLPPGQRAVVLMTDGADYSGPGRTCSTKTVDDVINFASDAITRVPIYTVAISQEVDTQDLTRLAELTGGRPFFVQGADDLTNQLATISQQLRTGYLLTYISATTSGEHQLFVQLDSQGNRDQDVRKFIVPPPLPTITVEGVIDGQVVSSDLQMAVGMSGETQPLRIAFYVNNTLVVDDSQPPFTVEWAIADLTPGSYTLRFEAYDVTGTILADREFTVTVEPGTPAPEGTAQPDTIVFVGLSDGATVNGVTHLEVKLGSEEGVGRVEFYVGDTLLISDDASPFETEWDQTGYESGNYTVQAVVYDETGTVLGDKTITVTYQPAVAEFPWAIVIAVAASVLLIGGGAFVFLRRRSKPPKDTVPGAGPGGRKPGVGTLATLTVEQTNSPELFVGQQFDIWETSVTIGRGEECKIVIPDKAVSRHHATISLSGGGASGSDQTMDDVQTGSSASIVDEESKFGTFIGDKKIAPGESTPLANNALITLGKHTKLRFRNLRAGPSTGSREETMDDLVIGPSKRDDVDPFATQDQINQKR